MRAEPGAAIIAQRGDLRSAPQPISDAPVIKLVATGPVVGTVEGSNQAMVFARYPVGAASWTVRAPIERDQTFHIGWLPKGTRVLGTIGRTGDGVRRLAAPTGPLRWAPASPAGPGVASRTVEVIAHAPRGFTGTPTVWLFREVVAPVARADAEELAAAAADVASAELHRIGADATPPGRALYAAGDCHAFVTGTPVGVGSACVAAGPASNAVVTCVRIDVPAGPARPSPRCSSS